jgi:N-acetyl-beta-hexosaminidase
MIDFVYWLAAMEKVNKVPAGVYQSVYSERMNDDQLDTLLDNTLAARLVEFAQTQEGQDWEGTPAELLMKLEDTVSTRIIHSKDWPRNPIALSKRLVSLKASLQSQGISVELHRGKQRLITIKA